MKANCYTTFDGYGAAGLGSLLQLQILLYAYARIKHKRALLARFVNLGHAPEDVLQKDKFIDDINNFFNFPAFNDSLALADHIDEEYLVRFFSEVYLRKKMSYTRELAGFIKYNGPKHFDKSYCNVAIHIRVWNQWDAKNNSSVRDLEISNREMFNHNSESNYHINFLTAVIDHIKSRTDKELALHIFSEGVESDFSVFSSLPNLSLHIGTNLPETLYHLIFSDVLVTSKSSLSWSAHLFGQNKLVVARADFWHSWSGANTLLLNEDGNRVSFIQAILQRGYRLYRAIRYFVKSNR